MSWPRDAVCASHQSLQIYDTQSTVNEKRCWNIGMECYDVRKNTILLCFKNQDKQQLRTSSGMYPRRENSGAINHFRYLEKRQVQGTYNVFHFSSTTLTCGELHFKYAKKYMHYYIRNFYIYIYITKIRSGYLELLRVNRHGKGNRRIFVTLLQKRQNRES